MLALLAAVVIVVLGGRDPDRAASTHKPAPDGHVESVHSHQRPDPPAGMRPEESAAARAARRFLAGYLPYTYGAAPASEIRAVTAPLRRQLSDAPPRVPAADRGLKPRVLSLDLVRSRGDLGIDFEATVSDGRRRYPVFVGVRSDGERWLVVALW
jgi:hypothetical protein